MSYSYGNETDQNFLYFIFYILYFIFYEVFEATALLIHDFHFYQCCQLLSSCYVKHKHISKPLVYVS